MGQKPFVATEDQRQQVERLAGVGCTAEEILHCTAWGRAPISEATLRRHFEPELARGQAAALSRLKSTAYDLAVNGDKTMLIFLLKVRCCWRETMRVENTGPDGEPLAAPVLQAQLYLPCKDTTPPLAAELRLPTKDEPRPRSSLHEPPRAVRHEPPEPEPPRRVAGAVRAYKYPDPRF